jgi:hypothetical protein
MLGQLIGPSAFISSLMDEIWPAIMWECPSSSSAHAADDLIERVPSLQARSIWLRALGSNQGPAD